MSRYIDADAVKIRYRGGFHDDYVVDYDSFMKAPSIDIVRCGECKRANYEWSGVRCGLSDVLMGEDGFCSIGERNEL